MKVEYKGHKILRGLDGVDMRHLRPAAIITGKHEEKQLIESAAFRGGDGNACIVNIKKILNL